MRGDSGQASPGSLLVDAVLVTLVGVDKSKRDRASPAPTKFGKFGWWGLDRKSGSRAPALQRGAARGLAGGF